MTDEHQIEEIVERLLPLYTLSSELDSSSRDKALRKAFHLLTEGLDLSFRVRFVLQCLRFTCN